MKTIEEMADIIELRTWAENKPMTLSALEEQLESVLDQEDNLNAETCAQNIMDEFQSRQEMLPVRALLLPCVAIA